MTITSLPESGVERAPEPAPELKGRYRFGAFEIDLDAEIVTRDGVRVSLAPQPFRLLQYLLRSGGRMVTREALKVALWGNDTFIDFDRGLNFCILQLRTALTDDARRPAYIETAPRKGYRFVSEVVPLRAPALAPAAAPDAAPAGRAEGRSPRLALLLAAAVVLAALVVILLWRMASPSAAAASRRVTLAVLPLDNLSGERDAYLVEGLAEETITDLAQIAPERLAVVARTSVQQFRGTRKDVREIARTLGVDYVVEGSVRRQGDRIRATFQLIRAADQTHVWSETFDRDATDVLGLQSVLAARVAQALELRLVPRRQTRHDPRALEEYLRGRERMARRTVADVEAATGHLERATAIEPSFASAQVALAEAWQWLRGRGRLPVTEARTRIRAAADAALRAEPELAAAHSVAGMASFYYEWEFEAAEREFALALRANPSDVRGLHDFGWLLIARGRAGEGIDRIRRAQELDPLSLSTNMDIAWACIYSGRYDDAIAEAKRVIALDPAYTSAYACLQRAYELKGDVAAAAGAVEKRLRAGGKAGQWSALAALPPRELLRRFREEEVARLTAAPETAPYAAAQNLAFLGHREEAYRWLEEALRERSPEMPMLAADPMLASLRGEPRFQELVRRVGIR
jgi:TolB-like protein/DNA-binding winged helix-turn-helix (wHTH) protein